MTHKGGFVRQRPASDLPFKRCFLPNVALILADVWGSAPARWAAILQQSGHQRGPAGLMAGSEPLARVAVKILMEEHEIAPMRIGGETRVRSVTGAPTMLIASKESRQAGRQFARHLL